MTTLASPPIPGFRLGHPEQTPRLPFSATLPNDNLTERYRPRTLADVVGQGRAMFQLSTFLDAPYPVAFLFEGPTGVGKTSAARALTLELGLSLDSVDYFEIDSGKQDGEAVDRIIDLFRFPPMFGGYRVVVVNEADLMTPKAAHLWLSGLESIPDRTVLIFTTNSPEKFPDRFLDRTERIRFESDGRALKQDAQALIDSIWRKENGTGDPPRFDDIPDLIDRGNLISFRRVVGALGPILRARRSPRPDGSPTLAITTRIGPLATPGNASGLPVVPSRRAERTQSPRKRLKANEGASAVATRLPAKRSAGLARLQAEWNALLARNVTLDDECTDIVALVDSLKAERKLAPPPLWKDVDARLSAAHREMERLGAMAFEIEARIEEIWSELGR